MPSSHVAEALIVLLFAIRNYGRRAYFLIPIVIGLAMGTVYGRFHYISDVAVGTAIAFVIYWLTLNFYPTRKYKICFGELFFIRFIRIVFIFYFAKNFF